MSDSLRQKQTLGLPFRHPREEKKRKGGSRVSLRFLPHVAKGIRHVFAPSVATHKSPGPSASSGEVGRSRSTLGLYLLGSTLARFCGLVIASYAF